MILNNPPKQSTKSSIAQSDQASILSISSIYSTSSKERKSQLKLAFKIYREMMEEDSKLAMKNQQLKIILGTVLIATKLKALTKLSMHGSLVQLKIEVEKFSTPSLKTPSFERSISFKSSFAKVNNPEEDGQEQVPEGIKPKCLVRLIVSSISTISNKRISKCFQQLKHHLVKSKVQDRSKRFTSAFIMQPIFDLHQSNTFKHMTPVLLNLRTLITNKHQAQLQQAFNLVAELTSRPQESQEFSLNGAGEMTSKEKVAIKFAATTMIQTSLSKLMHRLNFQIFQQVILRYQTLILLEQNDTMPTQVMTSENVEPADQYSGDETELIQSESFQIKIQTKLEATSRMLSFFEGFYNDAFNAILTYPQTQLISISASPMVSPISNRSPNATLLTDKNYSDHLTRIFHQSKPNSDAQETDSPFEGARMTTMEKAQRMFKPKRSAEVTPTAVPAPEPEVVQDNSTSESNRSVRVQHLRKKVAEIKKEEKHVIRKFRLSSLQMVVVFIVLQILMYVTIKQFNL